jgi:hypothetical protein
MANTMSNKVSLDRMLRATVAEILEKNAEKFALSRSLESDVRELRAAVSRLERRVAALGRGGSGRKGRRAGNGRPGRPALYTHCTVADCGAEHYALGLCSKHYQQRRRGAVKAATRKRSARRR